MYWRQILALAIFASTLLTAFSQTASIGLALLAKANAGDPAAQVAVGKSYAAGSGAERSKKQVAADDQTAAEWFRKAAQQGYIPGEMSLADAYGNGKGLPRDMAMAAVWYRKAAEQGDVNAQGKMGVLYSFGQGVAQDYVEAYFWLDVAASAQGPDQQKYAANRQMIGTHITADELEAVQERVTNWLAAHPRPNQTPRG
jgi:TPR repeat protein